MADADAGASAPDVIERIETPIRLEYEYTPGRGASRFLRGLLDRKLLGQRCPECRKVYVPTRGACPTDGVATEEEVQVSERGTVATFCIVNVPFATNVLELPYVTAQILLDGADTTLMHLVQEIPASEVRMGLRVEAVWKDDAELEPSLTSIKYFRPTGEPDAAFETYRDYL
jgi:uncharacterized OB-fold protein